jgi:hypothetical protein
MVFGEDEIIIDATIEESTISPHSQDCLPEVALS